MKWKKCCLCVVNNWVFAISTAPYNSVPLMMRKKRECNEFSNEYLDEMNKAGIDAILCPGSITPAPDKASKVP